MPTFIRAFAVAACCALFLPASAQVTYQRWWQYENRAEKLTSEQLRLATQLAEQGDVESEMLICATYRKGLAGTEKNAASYQLWLQRAAEHGHPEAQFSLAKLYGKGFGETLADLQKMVLWTRRSAEQNHIVAMHNLGSYYATGIPKVLPRDSALAEQWLTRSAEAGFTHAQFILGMHYMDGKNRAPDPEKGEPWLRKAAQHGHVLAMTYLARHYSNSDDAPRDPDFVERILLLASEMRRPEPQYYLARMYRRGTLGRIDLPHAVEWLEISAGKGYAPSQFLLGELYEKGEGVPTNLATAAQLFLDAAALGYSPAICKTAQVYYRGLGVPPNNAEAYKWSLIGDHLGAPECSAGLKKIESELDEKARTRVKQDTEAWIAANPRAMSQPLGKYRWPFGVMVPDDPPSDVPPSTPEDRAKMVKYVAEIAATPFGEEATRKIHWVSAWINDIPDIFFLGCTQLLERDKAKSPYPGRKLLEQQMYFSGAAYQVQHPEGKDQLAIYQAGLLGMATAYEALLARDPNKPELRWPVMETVIQHRDNNTLYEFTHRQANLNCR